MASITTQWILELVDKITGPMRGITDAAHEASKGVGEVSGKAKETGSRLKNLTPVDIYAVSQSVNQLKDGFDQLMQPGIAFDSQMKDLSALTGITGKQLDILGDKARESGKAFGVDASGMLESYKGILSRFGPDMAKDSDALAQMGKDVATLSKTMGNDSVASMDALTTAALQFGVDLSKPQEAARSMTTMMNIMAAGAKEGAAEVPDISAALKQAGVEAYNAHVSFAETNAALQALAQGGKNGAEAGVALRNVFTRMAGLDIIPRRAREKLKELGVNFDIVSNKSLPLTTRLKELAKAQGDSTLVAEMFGVENSAAANILLRQIPYIEVMTKKIKGTNTATEQADIVMGGYGERLKKVTAWIKDLGISFFSVGKYIAPFITGIAGAVLVLANLANTRTGLKLLFDLFGKIPKLGWISIIVSGLILIGTYLWNTSATVRGFLMGLWESVKTVFTGIGKFIWTVLQGIWKVIKGVFNPANWFNKNYHIADGFKEIANAAKVYGEAIGKAYSEGRNKGIASFNKDKQKEDSEKKNSMGPLDIKNVSPIISSSALKSKEKGSRSGSGGGSSIKNISQRIEIKNYFTGKESADYEHIAEKVVRAINDRLRDGLVAIN